MNVIIEKLNGEDAVRTNFVPQTNAERIRNMSDEELAEFLTEHHRHPCKFCVDCWTESGGGCKDELMRWLKTEVKEET